MLRRTLLERDSAASLAAAAAELVGPVCRADRLAVYDVCVSTRTVERLSQWCDAGRPPVPVLDSELGRLGALLPDLGDAEAFLDSAASEVHPLLARANLGFLLHDELAIRRLLWLPFRHHADGFSMLVVERIRDDAPWTEEELCFAEAAVDQLAWALDRLEVLQRLDGSEERCRLLLDESPLMHFIVDREGIVRGVNRSALETLGYERAELVGRSLLTVVHPGEHHQVLEELAACFAPPRVIRRMAFRKIRKDGSMVWVKDVARVLQWPEGPLLLFACENITELRQQAEAARSAESKSDKMDEFMAVLGHELRNPLTPIVTALELLRLRGFTGREIDTIGRQVAHLRRLVDDLLDISRITRGKVELHKKRQELAEIATRAVEMVEPIYARRRQRLIVTIPTEGLLVEVDAGRLVQVFSNLLTNASKFSPDGGDVVFSARQEGDRVVVEVRDYGEGIDPDLLGRVFDIFVQRPQAPDRAKSGLGLGLAIVRNLVELHGGSVRAKSDGRGQGATFEVELPLADGPAHPEGEQHDVAYRRHHPRGGCVLVVDDNRDVREMLCLAMEDLGFHACGADDGPTALSKAAEISPDVALVDIGLPGMDGYQVARELRRAFGSRLKLVAITGYGQLVDRDRAYDSGFDVHLTKPVPLEKLRTLVDDHLAEGR